MARKVIEKLVRIPKAGKSSVAMYTLGISRTVRHVTFKELMLFGCDTFVPHESCESDNSTDSNERELGTNLK